MAEARKQTELLSAIYESLKKRDNYYIIEKTAPKKTAQGKVITLEEKILSQDKWQKVLDELLKKDIVSFSNNTKKYRWNGIQRNNIASLAALATIVEKKGIVDRFSTYVAAGRAYFNFFSPKRINEREWGEYFEQAVPPKYSAAFEFINKIAAD